MLRFVVFEVGSSVFELQRVEAHAQVPGGYFFTVSCLLI